MNISILSLYPEILSGFCENPIVKRAQKNGLVSVDLIDIKKYTDGCFRRLDDSPYGGGKGMIMRVDAFKKALDSIEDKNAHKVLLSPKGRTFNQGIAKELASYSSLVFICGHFEGMDARIESYADECISIGDYILSGGESAAGVICDSVIRLIPGVLKDGVTDDESFSSGLLECNQYTHPASFEGMDVPSVLLSGNRAEIEKYKRVSSLMETAKYRPDLLLFGCDNGILYFDGMEMIIGDNLSRLYHEKKEAGTVLGYHHGDKDFLLIQLPKE